MGAAPILIRRSLLRGPKQGHQNSKWLKNGQFIYYNFFFQFHDSRITRAASASLRQCLRTRCCPIDATYYIQGITGNVCKVSNQENGYNIVNFYGHSAAGS